MRRIAASAGTRAMTRFAVHRVGDGQVLVLSDNAEMPFFSISKVSPSLNVLGMLVGHRRRVCQHSDASDRRSAVALIQPSDHVATSAAQRGFDWLAAQMPRVAFPSEIERFIGDVADLKCKRLSIPTCSSRWEQPMCARALKD
jgi:hypothetical protein